MENEVFTGTVEPREQERKGVNGRDMIKRVRRIGVCIGVRVTTCGMEGKGGTINVAAVGKVL